LPFQRSANNTFDDKLRQAYFIILPTYHYTQDLCGNIAF